MSQPVQPSPTPQTIMVIKGERPDNGQDCVIMQVASCTGVYVIFMPAEMADKIGDRMREVATQVRTGLQVVGPGFVPPVPPPNGHGHG